MKTGADLAYHFLDEGPISSDRAPPIKLSSTQANLLPSDQNLSPLFANSPSNAETRMACTEQR